MHFWITYNDNRGVAFVLRYSSIIESVEQIDRDAHITGLVYLCIPLPVFLLISISVSLTGLKYLFSILMADDLSQSLFRFLSSPPPPPPTHTHFLSAIYKSVPQKEYLSILISTCYLSSYIKIYLSLSLPTCLSIYLYALKVA